MGGMKLVIATPLYPPESGGPATYAKLLETELPKRGWEVEVVKFSSVRHLPKVFRHIAYGWKVYTATKGADALLALDPVSTGFPAHAVAQIRGIPFYVKIVGDYAWEQGTQRFGIHDSLDVFTTKRHVPIPVKTLRLVQEHTAKSAKRIIVPSKYWQKLLHTWGIEEERVRVIYNAARHTEACYLRLQEKPYVVSVSRLVPWKGFAGVIRAFKKIEDPELKLVIVGGGPERSRLEALVRELELSSRVLFTGALSHEETMAYIAHAEAFVLNTQYEGFSHLILEAFALGTPVLTTAVGGNPEQVTDGETGILFEPDDSGAIAEAIHRVRTESGLKDRLTANAKKKLESFSVEQLVKGVIETITP